MNVKPARCGLLLLWLTLFCSFSAPARPTIEELKARSFLDD
ncbi:MAG: hypothetical protein ACREUE_02420 [Panacagrimonas sp.]